MAASLSFFSSCFLLLFLFLHLKTSDALGIEVGIDIGGQPTPSSCRPQPTLFDPKPSNFENEKQYEAYLVIQRFKRNITCDPKSIIRSWVRANVCNYTGFYCDEPPNAKGVRTITAIDFNGYALAASTIPSFLDDLPDLTFFHANTNNFSGTVPDLSKLPFIYELDFSNNKLSGRYPTTTTTIDKLVFLDICYNFFSEKIEPSVFNLELEFLFLNNDFEGRIPKNLGRTTARYLTLANNMLTGTIPRSIGRIGKTLEEVVLLNNKLTGCLPYEMGLLKKAIVVDIGDNLISGEIPYSFSCLGKVKQLNLAENKLSGDIPDVVCKIPNLLNLSLSDNYFTSLGHSCRKLMKKGILDVGYNCITGLPNQRSLEESSHFKCEHSTCPTTPSCYEIMSWNKGSWVATSPTYATMDKPKS